MERGFRLNESVNQTNISPETNISKRLIKVCMLANKMTVDTINITIEMIKAYWGSHLLYVQHLEDQRKKNVLSEAEVQAAAISLDIDVLSLKYSQMQNAMQMMTDEFMECMKLAEEKNDMIFVIQVET